MWSSCRPTLFTNLKLPCHICWRVCSPSVTYYWFPVILYESWYGAANAHSFRKTWFDSIWGVHDLTHSLYVHYIIYQSQDYVYVLMTGLFAWISQIALSLTYFIVYIPYYTCNLHCLHHCLHFVHIIYIIYLRCQRLKSKSSCHCICIITSVTGLFLDLSHK